MLLLHLGNNFLLEKRKNNSASLRSRLGSRRSHRGAVAADCEWCCLKPFKVLGISESCLLSASPSGQNTHAHTRRHTPLHFLSLRRRVFLLRLQFWQASIRLSCLTVLYSFHVLWKFTLPSSLRWMTVHPPPALSMLQYTYMTHTHFYEANGTLVGPQQDPLMGSNPSCLSSSLTFSGNKKAT